MIIQDYNIQLDSSRVLVKHHEKNEHLRAWNGDNRLEISNQDGKTDIRVENFRSSSALVDISQEGMAKFLESANKKFSIKTPIDQLAEDEELQAPSKYQLMKMILERFFGIEVKIVKPEKEGESEEVSHDAPAPRRQGENQSEAAPQPQGWGIHYTYHELNYEKETVNFSAAGAVTTGDGKEINFDVNLEMSKEKLEQINIEYRAGDALIDPLALNFDGRGVQLTDEKYQFDLDADGEAENISFLEKGSGFLVLDKNQNGVVDNGSELFGPETNHGFLELEAYDEDQNDWIDENDAIYYQLNIWTKNEDGGDNLAGLKEYDIGAIYLNSARTSFDLEEGQLRESGIYLKESGEVNFIQEVDLRVTA